MRLFATGKGELIMGLNDTPSGNRVHIGFFGLRNAGKSSLVNKITGQDMSVVSDVAGTTTDPVNKAMELLPIGPVVITDTAGYDDCGSLGELRVEKTKLILERTDIAVLVADCVRGLTDYDYELLDLFKKKNIKYIIAYNKCDMNDTAVNAENDKIICDMHDFEFDSDRPPVIYVSAKTGTGIYELKELLGRLYGQDTSEHYLVRDLVKPYDKVVLVIPIDKAAPKGRLILPQQQVIRDLLEGGAIPVITRDTELSGLISSMQEKPALVITDSQAFKKVMKIVPEDIKLTSFSILFARYKGQLDAAVAGAKVLDDVKSGDKILISEGCTHHRQCDDIGTVKLPAWIREYTGKNPEFSWSSGGGFPSDLSGYRLIVHCGGCMLSDREMKRRLELAESCGVSMTNYGTAIAYMNGILKRSIEPLGI